MFTLNFFRTNPQLLIKFEGFKICLNSHQTLECIFAQNNLIAYIFHTNQWAEWWFSQNFFLFVTWKFLSAGKFLIKNFYFTFEHFMMCFEYECMRGLKADYFWSKCDFILHISLSNNCVNSQKSFSWKLNQSENFQYKI